LIGAAISARQTMTHHMKILKGYVINTWNKAIRGGDSLKSEEIFGYPLDYYGKYAERVGNYLPRSTKNKIIANGNETAKWTSGLYDCYEVIDLDFVDG